MATSTTDALTTDREMHYYAGWPQGISCGVPAEKCYSSIRTSDVNCPHCRGLLGLTSRRDYASLGLLLPYLDLSLLDVEALERYSR